MKVLPRAHKLQAFLHGRLDAHEDVIESCQVHRLQQRRIVRNPDACLREEVERVISLTLPGDHLFLQGNTNILAVPHEVVIHHHHCAAPALLVQHIQFLDHSTLCLDPRGLAVEGWDIAERAFLRTPARRLDHGALVGLEIDKVPPGQRGVFQSLEVAPAIDHLTGYGLRAFHHPVHDVQEAVLGLTQVEHRFALEFIRILRGQGSTVQNRYAGPVAPGNHVFQRVPVDDHGRCDHDVRPRQILVHQLRCVHIHHAQVIPIRHHARDGQQPQRRECRLLVYHFQCIIEAPERTWVFRVHQQCVGHSNYLSPVYLQPPERTPPGPTRHPAPRPTHDIQILQAGQNPKYKQLFIFDQPKSRQN